ncbi:Uncharacterized protein PECH_006305 [Penicillium ucsense]|uniref:Uncharacterized protein n=1 Tax=Penicillium ucsense TaxID=2839758 RepID=A0A8J8W762_9EURO|nr:Uncharacterized protein PECM_000348 [Penicillium ucsense]KAF7739101.1 Uncharacterized protein PECH_006305 [Penicillium ucsense]
MSVARQFLRTCRAGRNTLPTVTRLPTNHFSTTRANCLQITDQKNRIPEKEVPVTDYDAGHSSAHKRTLPVNTTTLRDTSSSWPDPETVDPLTRDVYEQMPKTMRNMSMFGKTVIITGGARGLGNHMARACAEAGAKNIVIFDANQELGDEAAAELHDKTGLPISFYRVDVRDAAAITASVQACVEKYGVPDVLINSAGIADSNIKAETYDVAMFRRLIDINLTGSFLMSQAVGRTMIAAGKPGSIILVASMSGTIVNYPQEQSCYNASKAGVIQLAKSLAAEWAKNEIRVNCISPGYMDTALNRVPALEAQKKIWKSLTPQNRLGNVDELNGLCVFLGSDASKFMTGANCIIDGGYTCY